MQVRVTRPIILTVTLLTDFVEDTEKLWCYWGQGVKLHFLEIFWTIFLQMSITFAQAAHDHVGLCDIERSYTYSFPHL